MRVCVCMCACVSAPFPPIYNIFPGIRQALTPLSHNVGCLLMLVWVWNILVTYHDVPDLHIHKRLHEYMYVRMLGCMSTPLYVHVTHTQHTHTRTHNTHTTLAIMHFPHNCSSAKSLSNFRAETSELLGRISTSELDPQSLCCVFFCFVLLCMCACMYLCAPLPPWSFLALCSPILRVQARLEITKQSRSTTVQNSLLSPHHSLSPVIKLGFRHQRKEERNRKKKWVGNGLVHFFGSYVINRVFTTRLWFSLHLLLQPETVV